MFDLDGTVSLDHHRRHMIPLWLGPPPADELRKCYATYHAACGGDAPNWPVIKALQAHRAAGHRVEVWTGRASECRALTLRMLNDWGVRASSSAEPKLLMRPEGDVRSAPELKRAWLRDAAREGAIPDLAYDDREDCAAVFRARGVQCLLVGLPDAQQYVGYGPMTALAEGL